MSIESPDDPQDEDPDFCYYCARTKNDCECDPADVRKRILEDAAPELLEALKKLASEAGGFLTMADRGRHGNTNVAVLRLRIDEAIAAIAKATASRPEGA